MVNIVEEKKECDVCGYKDGIIRNSRKHGKTLCEKHYQQLQKTGRIIPVSKSEPNHVIEHDLYYEIILRDNNGSETGRAKISKESLKIVTKYKWRLKKGRRTNYAITHCEKGKSILMHRLIANENIGENNLTIDHFLHLI